MKDNIKNDNSGIYQPVKRKIYNMFPYVNGSLFAKSISIPTFSAEMRTILLGCCSFNWGKVSPVIFGSLFQSVMDKEKRRNLGAHYTSEKNIMKVVKGLFLDELRQEFETVKHDARKLGQLHDRISKMRFFDPACGCGNFLIITYRELRLLEIEIMQELRRLSGRSHHQLVIDVSLLSQLDVDNMYGIEMEEFPAKIAEVALWLTDHQMNMALSAEFGSTFIRLPLVKSANIHNGNALRMDWKEVLSISSENSEDTVQPIWYILGNPPFIGKHLRNSEQNQDMEISCAAIPVHGVMDYVCAWYVKAAQLIQNSNIRVAFVSTNSITQGEQVGVLWQYLLAKGITINFAHRTFRWSNEARGNAAVFCVIIGFSAEKLPWKKLYDYPDPDAEPMEIKAKEINPYLANAPTVVIGSRKKPLCNVPEMIYGSKPTDNGFLLLTDEDKDKLLQNEPGAKPFIQPLISAHEFINGYSRWCLWLVDADPKTLRNLPQVMKRIEGVKDFRLQSKKDATVRLADVPYLFAEIRQPKNDYVLIPQHSSENRKYIPLAFFGPEAIVHNSSSAVPNATIYHFGVLTSAMHMAWMRQVCGRIKGDYRYSNTIVYNNFPWPESPNALKIARVEAAAKNVLEARSLFPSATLADLYDQVTMPKSLLDAHKSLDIAVDACYRGSRFKSELERLEFLFALYKNILKRSE